MFTSGVLLFDSSGRVRASLTEPVATITGTTPCTADGLLAIVDDVGTIQFGACVFDADGRVATEGAAPQFYSQGLPWRTAGRLAIADGGTVAFVSQGLPFTSAGRLAVAVE